MDARHYFTRASQLTDALGIKDAYLNLLRGERGTERYENYPVFYRLNSPKQFLRHAAGFRRIDFISLARVGQLDHYVPRQLRFLTNFIDRATMRRGQPGSIFIVPPGKMTVDLIPRVSVPVGAQTAQRMLSPAPRT